MEAGIFYKAYCMLFIEACIFFCLCKVDLHIENAVNVFIRDSVT